MSHNSKQTTKTVNSDTIVKYEGITPSKFCQLSLKTNLNNPPDNWLCGSFGHYNWSYPIKRNNSSMLSSFRMANNFPECVGSVDVIAEAESIKKLLFMPFDSSSHVSLMVHRVGNTLLIDEFDLANHLIRSDAKQWSWLKKFFAEHIIAREKSTDLFQFPKKPLKRYDLQSNNMLCKFLHYSVEPNSLQNSENTLESCKSDTNTSDEQESDTKNSDPCVVPEMVEKQLDTIENKSGSNFSGPLRNVLWTFEDIRMLVSSNMPIFGDEDHPAVSLRLLDMKRPINVLTGLDYWLDNLMCSVPEVVMCYHLDGIVQKYELINTEDIPHMSANKNSQFSQKVIRHIAQNILTFLKSKATKSGHTYWLFKGRHDDVVKLYDLTILCADSLEEDDVNPYTLPVAMLLYRVAKNMRDSNKSHSPVINSKIHKLLTNCLSLLDPVKHSQFFSSAKYLLSDIYVPNDIDPTLLPLKCDDENEDYDDVDDYFDESDSGSDEFNAVSTLEINKLSIPNYYAQSNYDKQSKQKHENLLELKDMDWSTKCDYAIKAVIEGLKTICDTRSQKQESSYSQYNENPKMANPYEAIPLHFTPIKSKETVNGNVCRIGNEISPTKQMQSIYNWKTYLSICLLQKGAQIYCIYAELSNTNKRFSKALNYARLGVLCYECAQIVLENSEQNNYLKEPIVCLLALCGDIHMSILASTTNLKDCEQSDCDCDTESNSNYFELIELLEKVCQNDLKEEYRWAYKPFINSENIIEDRLKLCYRCYEEALFQLKDTTNTNYELKAEKSLPERIKKRLGNTSNELANFYMNQSLQYFNSLETITETETNKLDLIIKKSLSYFEMAVNMFRDVNDNLNTALILSNTGRLMRTCAHIFAPRDRHSSEFSAKEKHFYLKAIEYYNKAYEELGTDGEKQYITIWDNITWELSTTLFTMGCLMQDYAPLSKNAFETIEHDISKYLNSALNLCLNAEKWDSSRLILYQYRAAKIYHRLASLYHNSYRNEMDENRKRKKDFNTANDYYTKSRLLFKQLNNKVDFIRISLEQIGLHERNLLSLTGFGSKVKALYLILSIMLSLNEVDFNDTSDLSDEEKVEFENLLELFETRMHLCVKGVIKCLSTKTSKNKDAIKNWNEIENYISSDKVAKNASVYDRIKNVFMKLNSSHLFEYKV